MTENRIRVYSDGELVHSSRVIAAGEDISDAWIGAWTAGLSHLDTFMDMRIPPGKYRIGESHD